MRSLRENQRVGYDLEPDRRGKMSAVNIRSADDAAPASDSEEAAGEAE
jgi:CspA family cold shock protein